WPQGSEPMAKGFLAGFALPPRSAVLIGAVDLEVVRRPSFHAACEDPSADPGNGSRTVLHRPA
ncbi:hypothetical protein, partial [Streptomyces sp. NPDC055990]|uniref:hypothetical protein n=1 Tax=Streptomyces sp. NPDC055990 TaxID=3345672 RepID=UPI0035E2031C